MTNIASRNLGHISGPQSIMALILHSVQIARRFVDLGTSFQRSAWPKCSVDWPLPQEKTHDLDQDLQSMLVFKRRAKIAGPLIESRR